ncbi:unnamed protein product [Schistosoma curassoni]|uniref:Reverse transcriptase domain-containing protein n=1 Tax=Schistosoma curassoni TaxID=6186 RepID=A0A183JY57_9TREM|nr:unnamed protein product [Schistosoma curassoni]
MSAALHAGPFSEASRINSIDPLHSFKEVSSSDLMNSDAFHSIDCTTMFRSVAIRSVHDRSLQNPFLSYALSINHYLPHSQPHLAKYCTNVIFYFTTKQVRVLHVNRFSKLKRNSISMSDNNFESLKNVNAFLAWPSDKSRGSDNIRAQALKADVAATARIPHILFNKILDEEQVPRDWEERLLIEILKKGDLSKCDNYRGITLLSIPENIFNRVLLNRMRGSVDAQLRDRQVGLQQSIEWNSSLYINFIDYEKALDSVNRTTLWNLVRHYGVPQKIVNIIWNSYDGLNCKIVHGGLLTKSFEEKTSVRQDRLLSPFFFFLVIDRIMMTSTSGMKHGIKWTARIQVDGLEFVDDLSLLSHTQQQMQEMTTSVASASAAAVGLNIHKGNSKILRYKTAYTNWILIYGEALMDVKTLKYLGSIIDEQGGSDAYVNAQSKRNIFTLEEHLEIETTVNKHQGHNFQCKCQNTFNVWGGNLENYHNNHPEDTGVY